MEELRKELQAKIKELEWKNQLRSLEMIEWIKWLLSKLEAKEEVKPEPIKVELKEEVEEKKPAPKKKIVFKKK